MLTQGTNVQYSLFSNSNEIVMSAPLIDVTTYEYIKTHSKSGTLHTEDIGQLYEAELAELVVAAI